MNEPVYQEAINYLYSLTQSGIKLGLENTARLLQHFGNPQLKTRTIHIGGTNGKGSTAAITESILKNAGYKVGLYTSPHLLDFRERIQINRIMIEKQQTIDLINRIKSAAEKLGVPVTFFEFGTILAFLYFYEENTDINVIEVGLGGRLDATNLCHAEVSIITSISKDHTEYLGEDLKQIAFEKASIIKKSGTIFANVVVDELFEVVSNMSKKCSADLYRLGVDFKIDSESGEQGNKNFNFKWKSRVFSGLTLPLTGSFQKENAGLALAACIELQKNGLKIEELHFRKGLEMVNWEGRLETVFSHPTVVLDCAHNEESVRNLTQGLIENFKFTRCFFILGLMQDKDIDKIINLLSLLGDHFFLVPVNPPRGEAPEKLAEKLKVHNKPSQIFLSVSSALQAIKKFANPRDLICITGSIFLVAAAKKYFHDETNLFNSWNTPYSNE